MMIINENIEIGEKSIKYFTRLIIIGIVFVIYNEITLPIFQPCALNNTTIQVQPQQSIFTMIWGIGLLILIVLIAYYSILFIESLYGTKDIPWFFRKINK